MKLAPSTLHIRHPSRLAPHKAVLIMPSHKLGALHVVSDRPTTSGEHGFTLIELLVTITVAAILAAVALPSFLDMIQRNRISVTARNLRADLAYARSESVRRGGIVSICIATVSEGFTAAQCSEHANWSDGWIVFVDANGNGSVDSGDTILRQRTSERNISVTSISGSIASATSIHAMPAGEFSEDGTLRICAPRFNGIDLSIQRSGSLRSQSTPSTC